MPTLTLIVVSIAVAGGAGAALLVLGVTGLLTA
jgi:hypothetical protein